MTTIAVGYARISSEMQADGFSIAAQERAIRAYCEQNSWDLKKIYVDEARSARSDDLTKRPEFARMLEDIERGGIDALVVHKLDRFARNIVTTITTLQRLEKHGVGFASISENMDFTTPIGKAMLAMLAAFAQYYSDNLSNETKKGKAERKKQGLYNGSLPYGYMRGEDGRATEDTVPVCCNRFTRSEIIGVEGLRMIFELAADGESDRDIARTLNQRGYITLGNRGRNPFTKDTIRVILGNRFYLGELPDGEGGWLPGKHEALIDPVTFESARERRTQRSTRLSSTTTGAKLTPFTGLLVCGECGSPMRSQSRAVYRCSRSVQGAPCTEPGIGRQALEHQVLSLLDAISFDQVDLNELIEEVKAWRIGAATKYPNPRDLEAKSNRIKRLFIDGAITIEEYQREARQVREEMQEIPPIPEIPDEEEYVKTTMRLMANLRNSWLKQDERGQNEMLATFFSAIYVKNRTVVALLPRPNFCAFLASFFRPPGRRGGSDGLQSLHLRRRVKDTIQVSAIVTPSGSANSGDSPHPIVRSQKLSQDDMTAIWRDSHLSLRALAERYHVSRETIRKVRNAQK